MKNKYLKYLLIFILVLVSMDKLIGIITESRLSLQTTGVIGIVNKTIKDSSDILILGSSRAQNHYNSQIIEKRTNQTIFNGGIGGTGIFYTYAVLKERFKLHKPKTVVLDVAANIMIDLKQYDKLAMFHPLIKKYNAFDSISNLNPNFKPFLTYSNAYRYNSTTFEIFYDLISPVNNNDAFIAVHGTLDQIQKLNEQERKQSKIATNEYKLLIHQLEYIDKIKLLCQINNTELLVFISPSFKESIKEVSAKSIIINHLKAKEIVFYDFSIDQTFIDKNSLFKDLRHLNGKGATIFSEEVALIILEQKKSK